MGHVGEAHGEMEIDISGWHGLDMQGGGGGGKEDGEAAESLGSWQTTGHAENS